MTILECKNLTKEYLSGENVVKAVDNVSINFEQGEFCAITGPSGSGKSTFLHVLSSLENPTSGEVRYGEKSLSSYNDNQLSILRRRRFGFVFQAYNLVQELTGYENILLNPNVIVSSHSEALLFLHRFSYKQSVNLFSSKDRLKASFSDPSKVSFVYALSECSSVEERIVSMLSLTWLIFQNPLLSQVFQIYIQYAIFCSY